MPFMATYLAVAASGMVLLCLTLSYLWDAIGVNGLKMHNSLSLFHLLKPPIPNDEVDIF